MPCQLKIKYLNMKRKALTPRQHVLLPTKSSYGLLGKLSGRSEGDKLLDDIKEYFFVSSFKLMRSSTPFAVHLEKIRNHLH